jgi:outer membrane protein TolC
MIERLLRLAGGTLLLAPLAAADASATAPLTRQEAILLALEGDPSFRVARLQPTVVGTFADSARAAFDPVLRIDGSGGGVRSRDDGAPDNQTNRVGVGASVEQFLPTGTTLSAGVGGDLLARTGGPDGQAGTWDLQVTQALLRGGGLTPNLAALRAARVDREIAGHGLHGAGEALVANTEIAWWRAVEARAAAAIADNGLAVAQRQRDETATSIRIGRLASNDLTAAEAEMAARELRRQVANADRDQTRIELLRRLGPSVGWQRDAALDDARLMTAATAAVASVEEHVQLALRQRSDLAQALLLAQRGELEVARTRNGLLPRLDLFLRVDGGRYAESFRGPAAPGGRDVDASVGLNLTQELGGRAAEAAHLRARASAAQSQEAIAALRLLIEAEVRAAWLAVDAAGPAILAAEATVRLRETVLAIEQARLRGGRGTMLAVAIAERDLLTARQAALTTRVARELALLELYRRDGSLLERRGIGTIDAAMP